MAPSTFASAAAGGNQNRSSSRDVTSEWSRRPNGATQTFRRPSQAPSTMVSQSPAPPPARYVPPHRNGANPTSSADSMRYSKNQLLDLFKNQQREDGALADGLKDLYVGGWMPDTINGVPVSASLAWGGGNAQQGGGGVEIVWEKDGGVSPLGLKEMDDEERELFSTTVNTPIKPAPNKENTQSNGLPGRKTSISQSVTSPGGFGPISPSTARAPRRRDTSESYGFPITSPTNPAFEREQRAASPPPSLLRRRTDVKEPTKPDDRDKAAEEKPSGAAFGSIKRTQPAGLGGGASFSTSSPWSNNPQSSTFAPMGSFGNFGLGPGGGGGSVPAAAPSTSTDKRQGYGSIRSESRFKNVLSKEGGEELGGKSAGGLERKTSLSSLSKVHENESWRPQQQSQEPVDETDEDELLPSGSAALAAGSEFSPPHPTTRQGLSGYDTPSRNNTRDEHGFGAFGMHADNHAQSVGVAAFGGFGREAFEQTPSIQRSGPHAGNEPMSPTDTNPYQSPNQHGFDRLVSEESEDEAPNMGTGSQLPGLGALSPDPQGLPQQGLGGLGGLGGLPGLGGVGRGGPASDRSQTSSTGPTRGFSGLGGFGGLGAGTGSSLWPGAQGALSTPGQRTAGMSSAFGGGLFASSTVPDMQSPAMPGLGSSGPFGSLGGLPSGGVGGPRGGFGAFTGVQEQRGPSPLQTHVLGSQQPDQKQQSAESQDDNFSQPAQPPIHQQQSQQSHPLSEPQQQQAQQAQQPADALPPPQQRTMVMPDRMRWIYRDPQGQTQGPWSGLEMHDWYKAGFFSPELLVKKAEDLEYEPLAQLIRRIGNSREPFLVPQIGIPHGPPTSGAQGAGWSGGMGGVGSLGGGVGQGGVAPPFASSFPSFGTTLTAEQQNALERRKQEEQYLMARQKEHLAQAQIAQRMQQIHGQGQHAPPSGSLYPGAGVGAGHLHHTSSAQSLHSQPSFGSITSPSSAFQPSPSQGPAVGAGHVPGFPFAEHQQAGFGRGQTQGPLSAGSLGSVGAGVDSLGHIREEEMPGIMTRLNINQRPGQQAQFGASGQLSFAQHQQTQQAQHGQQHKVHEDGHAQQVQQMMKDRERLAMEQAAADAQLEGEPSSNERLLEFRHLQSQQVSKQPSGPQQKDVSEINDNGASTTQHQTDMLSLTDQVKSAASAKHSPMPPQSAVKQLEHGIPLPFPPAPSQSPLPAPAAQRSRPSVADHLHAESRSRSETPSADTPSAPVPAPWAKEQVEGPKGPGLKEIQEAETKRAAEAEAVVAAARRAALQKEIEAEAAVAAAAAAQQPGLPAASKWGSQIPAAPSGATPWSSKTGTKSTSGGVKTMAQIQKEEEARKKKLAAAQAQAQAQAMSHVAAPAGGKSYANTAGKISASAAPAPNAGGAWTTVGASGKTKTPAGQPPTPVRSASQSMQPSLAPKKTPTRSSTTGGAGAVMNAQDEFKKWAINELKPDLTKGANVEDIVASLGFLPAETDIITEAVHGISQTIDSRHFAEEFIRRKKLADKGLVDSSAPPKSASPANAAQGVGGWSEVAKKGPSKVGAGATSAEEAAGNGSFRVVPAKKKGGKR